MAPAKLKPMSVAPLCRGNISGIFLLHVVQGVV